MVGGRLVGGRWLVDLMKYFIIAKLDIFFLHKSLAEHIFVIYCELQIFQISNTEIRYQAKLGS